MGSRMADWIIENHPEVKVVGIDDLSGGYKENVNAAVEFRQTDCASGEMDGIFFVHRPDVVYHFAAYAAECLSPFIRKFNYTNNLVATANIVNMCIKYNVQRLVFTSSMAVYGHGATPFGEDDPRNPVDPYGVAKAACEMDIEIASKQHGLDYCILRPHNVYGAKQNIWDPYRNVIGIFMYKIIRGDPVTVFGDGKQKRAFSYIDDSLEPMWKAGTDSRAINQIINLGGINEYSINELAETVLNEVPICKMHDNTHFYIGHWPGTKIIHLPPRHEVRYAYSTYNKSVELLDFEHKTDLISGVQKMWDWVLEQPDRERFVWPHYELDQGLYPYWKQEALEDGFWNKVALMDSELRREII